MKTRLIEFLDALKVLTRHLWPDGGLDYDIHEIAGDVETAFERNRLDIYGNEATNVDRQEALIGEFAHVFARLMERTIDARSESLGVQLARSLAEPYLEPNLRFVASWDEDTWALSVVNTNSKRPYLLNMIFQYD